MSEPMSYREFATQVAAFADTLEHSAMYMLEDLGTTPAAYQVGLIQFAAAWLSDLAERAVADAQRQSTGGAAT